MSWNPFKKLGPATLITAAFIGPGTVTLCAKAGIEFGLSLLWALLIALVITLVFQEMAARIGIVTQNGLAEVIRSHIKNPIVNGFVTLLILSAIVIGNAAYEAGNLNGAVLGLEALFGSQQKVFYPWIIGAIAMVLLLLGSLRFLEKLLIGLVVFMSVSFLITAVLTAPRLLPLLKGLFVPSINDDNLYTVIALIGTTVVPYNLFLHASLAKERWKRTEQLEESRTDTLFAIALGGVISMAILVSASAIDQEKLLSVLDLSSGLEPLFGSFAKILTGLGLFAAGITSALTAPVAAAYVANACFNWKVTNSHWKFKAVSLIILGLGLLTLGTQYSPIVIIQFAQVTNGILLPILGVFIFWMANNKKAMGQFKNNKTQNIAAFIIVIFTFVMSGKTLFNIFVK